MLNCFTILLILSFLGLEVQAQKYELKKFNSFVKSLETEMTLTPLHRAARAFNIDSCKHILNNPEVVGHEGPFYADINKQDSDGKTALHHAIETDAMETETCKPLELCELLIKHGADVNIQDKDGKSVLHYIVTHRNIECAELLIKHGANVNIQDKDGRTPLHYSYRYSALYTRNDHQLIELLVKHDAQINIQDKYGFTPLIFTVSMYQKRNFYTIEFYNDFYRSFQFKKISHCAGLIKHGAHINQQDNYGKTALMYVAEIGNQDLCDLFIQHGADVTIRDKQGHTACNYALKGLQIFFYGAQKDITNLLQG